MTMGVLTYKKAKHLLRIGDKVFSIKSGNVVTHFVKAIFADSLGVGDDIFFYDDVGKVWFLTKFIATEKARGDDNG